MLVYNQYSDSRDWVILQMFPYLFREFSEYLYRVNLRLYLKAYQNRFWYILNKIFFQNEMLAKH